MDDFLKGLDILLEHAQATGELDEFSDKFNELVDEFKNDDDVLDVANIVAHNYNCHVYNRPKAIINTLVEWKEYNKEPGIG